MVILAKSAGMCNGVKRAVIATEKLAAEGRKVCVLGELVHNKSVMCRLREKGVRFIDKVSECPPDYTLVIRSHGVAKSIYGEINKLGLQYFDATCPNVKKIHDIAAKKTAQGETVLVAGDPKHPEVIGIVGHSADEGLCFAVETEDEITAIISRFRHKPLNLVSQTTYNSIKQKKIQNFLQKDFTNVKIYGTICKSTFLRQAEVLDLAEKCTAIIVVGSPASSNSRKLAEIAEQCAEDSSYEVKKVFFIEDAKELTENITAEIKSVVFSENLRGSVKTVGITAGASVPTDILKEVHKIMDEELKNNAAETAEEVTVPTNGDIDFMVEVDKSFKNVYVGNRVKAYVVAIHPNEVVVDIGVKQSGYIPADELSSDATKLPSEIVKTGDEIECIVTKKDDSEGIVYLSKKRADAALGFRKAVKAFEDNATITGTIIASIKGGFIVLSEGVRVFVPGSQSGLPRNAKPEDILKKQVRMKVIEINENRNRVVGSVRATFREGNPEAKAKIWDNIAVGQKFKGEVKSIQKYGAFVDLGGVDGMVHITELSWGKIRHPSDVISVGDKLEVYVKSFDKEKEKIALGAKDPDSDPWNRFMKDYQLGDVLRVKIVNVTPFGAFAEIIPGVDGLIHISQLSTERVDKVNDYAKIGQEVVVKITFIDEETKRISLSIRAVLEEDAAAATSEAESNGGSQNDSGEKPDSSDELKETENAKAE